MIIFVLYISLKKTNIIHLNVDLNLNGTVENLVLKKGATFLKNLKNCIFSTIHTRLPLYLLNSLKSHCRFLYHIQNKYNYTYR